MHDRQTGIALLPLDEQASVLSRQFELVIRDRVIHFQVAYHDGTGAAKLVSGTGCIVASANKADGTECYLIATAGHVLKARTATQLRWRIQPPSVVATDLVPVEILTSGDPQSHPDFITLLPDGIDIGAVLVPKGAWPTLPADYSNAITSIVPHRLVRTGTPAAWCGFPSVVERDGLQSVLCYYEGLVSGVSLGHRHGPTYFLDGRAHRGVSGGPVWIAQGASPQPVLIGVISRYVLGDELPTTSAGVAAHSPGLICAVPINALLMALGVKPKSPYDLTSDLFSGTSLESLPVPVIVALVARQARRMLNLLREVPRVVPSSYQLLQECVDRSRYCPHKQMRVPNEIASSASTLEPLTRAAIATGDIVIAASISGIYNCAVCAAWAGRYVIRNLKGANELAQQEARSEYIAAARASIAACAEVAVTIEGADGDIMSALDADIHTAVTRLARIKDAEFVFDTHFEDEQI